MMGRIEIFKNKAILVSQINQPLLNTFSLKLLQKGWLIPHCWHPSNFSKEKWSHLKAGEQESSVGAQTFQHKAPQECTSPLGFLQAAVPVDGTVLLPRQVIVCRTDTYCTACLSPWQPEVVNSGKGEGLPIYQRQQTVEWWGSEWEERKE